MADTDSPQQQNATVPPAADAVHRDRRLQRWAGVILVLLAAALYLATLDTGLQPYELHGGDLITHQYAQVQARPSNAPGYPLYTMGGWLWFHGFRGLAQLLGNPLPNPLPILSSYSTLWALLAVWLLYAIVCRLTRGPRYAAGNWPLAWLFGAFYAVTYFFWYYATTTEQYSSAVAQTLAIVYVYLLWREADEASSMVDGQRSMVNDGTDGAARPLRHTQDRLSPLALLFLLAFLCGLSLAHMLTVAFIVPPLVAVVLWQRPSLLWNPKAIVGSLIAAALPLVSYIFIYVRGAAHPEWRGEGEWSSAQAWFWAFVSTAQGREELGWGFEPGRAFFGNGFPELIWQELSIPLLLLGIFGIVLFDRKLATLLYGTIAITLLFSWAYRYGNWYQVILPIYPLILLGNVAIAQAWTRYWDARRRPSRAGMGPALAVAAPFLLLALATGWRLSASLPAADSRGRAEDTALQNAAILLDQALPATSFFATVDDALSLQYLTEIWGIQPDADVVSSLAAGEILTAGHPVLTTVGAASTLLAELPDGLALKYAMHGPDWIVVQPETGQATVTDTPEALSDVTAGNAGDVELIGYAVAPSPQGAPVLDRAPDAIDLTLAWRLSEGGWPAGAAISVRPTAGGAFMPDPDGEPGAIIQRDVAQPTLAANATDAAARSELIDALRLPFPPSADGLLLIVYRQTDDGFENLAEIALPVELPKLNGG